MVLTQWYQMRLNPMQLGPEMSEAQRINAKMMRFMPFMFLVFSILLFIRSIGSLLDRPEHHDNSADSIDQEHVPLPAAIDRER